MELSIAPPTYFQSLFSQARGFFAQEPAQFFQDWPPGSASILELNVYASSNADREEIVIDPNKWINNFVAKWLQPFVPP